MCEGPQDVIYYPHKISKGFCQPEIHNQPLKKVYIVFKGSLPYIYGLYWNIVIVTLQIDLVKILGLIELVQQVINLWDYMPPPHSDFV